MCLIAYEKNMKKRRAYRDIPVFKILKKDNHSYWISDFQYTLGKAYSTKLGVIDHGTEITVNEGFHSFLIDNTVLKVYFQISEQISVGVYEKNSYRTLDGGHAEKEGLLIARGYIPKNSTYVTDGHGQIVSTRICIEESYPAEYFLKNPKMYDWLKTGHMITADSTGTEILDLMYGTKENYMELMLWLMTYAESTHHCLKTYDLDSDEVYEAIEKMRHICGMINSDARGTGTLIKNFR